MTADHSLGRKPKAPPSSLGLAHGIFAAVLALRLIALARLSASPFALPTTGDMNFYHEWARRILHGQLTDHLAFYGLPLYAYFLAFVYLLFGVSPFTPSLLQILFDAGTAVLLYRISVRVFAPETDREDRASLLGISRGRAIGIIAAAGWGFFVPAQAYSIVLMPTAFAVFVFWFAVWKIVERDEPPSPLLCLVLSLLIGFTAMAVATILFAVPLLVAAIWLRASPTPRAVAVWKHRAVPSILVIIGVVIGCAPCWIHNRFIAHDRVFLSAHSGINFWIGNNPDANGYPRFPGLRAGQAAALEDSIEIAEAAAGGPLPRSAVSSYWSAKACSYLAADFGSWLRLLGRKVGNFWNAFEYDDVSVIAKLRESGVVLPGVRFGIVATLGVVGACLLIRKFPLSRWIVAAIVLQLVAVLPVFVTERYRLPAVPGLLVLAAASIWFFWRNCACLRFRSAMVEAALIAVVVIPVAWPQRNPTLWALELYNAGTQALDSNDLPRAQTKLNAAYGYAPGSAEINFALGNLRLEEHNVAAAKLAYAATLAIDPNHRGTLNNLGVLAFDEGYPAAAARYFFRSLAQEPKNAKTHYLLAKSLAASGDEAGARVESARALTLEPDQIAYKELSEQLNGR